MNKPAERKPRVVAPTPTPAPIPTPPAAAAPAPKPAPPAREIPSGGIAGAVPAKIDDAPSGLDEQRAAAIAAAEHPTCAICHCSQFATDKHTVGICRRNPPVHTTLLVPRLVQVEGQPPFEYGGTTNWPIVKRADWCVNGFSPKPGMTQ